jgi:hypothetical protein
MRLTEWEEKPAAIITVQIVGHRKIKDKPH